jgi:hypothetical protein
MADASFVVKNTLVVNGAFVANSTQISLGNTVITPAGFTGTVSTAQANVLSQTLTDGATVSWNTANGQIAYLTLGGNRTISNPSNLKVGTYILHLIQDGTGNRTVTWGSAFKWVAGVAPVLSTGANKRDLFSFVSDGTNLYGSYLPDVR